MDAQPVALPDAVIPVGAFPVEQRVGVAARAVAAAARVAVAALPVVLWFRVRKVFVAEVRSLFVTVWVFVVVRTLVANMPESFRVFAPVAIGRFPLVIVEEVVFPPPDVAAKVKVVILPSSEGVIVTLPLPAKLKVFLGVTFDPLAWNCW